VLLLISWCRWAASCSIRVQKWPSGPASDRCSAQRLYTGYGRSTMASTGTCSANRVANAAQFTRQAASSRNAIATALPKRAVRLETDAGQITTRSSRSPVPVTDAVDLSADLGQWPSSALAQLVTAYRSAASSTTRRLRTRRSRYRMCSSPRCGDSLGMSAGYSRRHDPWGDLPPSATEVVLSAVRPHFRCSVGDDITGVDGATRSQECVDLPREGEVLDGQTTLIVRR